MYSLDTVVHTKNVFVKKSSTRCGKLDFSQNLTSDRWNFTWG